MQIHEVARINARIEGRVQGVGFRYHTWEIANRLGVNGWVRNRWDGSVEVLAEGEKTVLDELIAKLWKGPRTAFVTHVKVDKDKPTGEFDQFSMEKTV